MPVSFDSLVVGRSYDRPELAEIWGYEDFHAIAKGAVTPRDTPYIILFITKEKQGFMTQYQDNFADGILEIEGETNHMADRRIVEADQNGDEIHLFYRERHHSPFIYQGRVFLTQSTLLTDQPSHFRFATKRTIADVDADIVTEEETHGVSSVRFVPDAEGQRRMQQSVRYERSRKNRSRALEIHGNRCVVCGFDFNAFYGADLAKGYIEVHHTRSITGMEGRELNVEEDLLPVCSNCHSMAHRRHGEIISAEELRERIRQARERSI